ncbi:MAG: alpha/beta hydrolase-fold protein [Saprospiraceae bacterium]|nr:alpha/beta hydrolase-fold protein [Saprospiraceae bacterium]MDW8485151.1 alpha/beta hydrolase-fold protein [Saprospiraceae bacterium]
MKQVYRILWLSLWAFAVKLSWATGQLTVVLNSLPPNTPANEPIYIAGSFNGWAPADPAMRLERNAAGKYQVRIHPPIGSIHFSFTRGNWSIAEGNNTGEYPAVHLFYYNGGAQTIHVDVSSWRVSNQSVFNGDKKGTVAVIDDNFFMPQLNRTRRIYAYLPPNYYASAGKRYPVLYMQDGQTLFQKSVHQSEEWEIDESIDRLVGDGHYGCIVIGIESSGVNQMNEYSPWFNTTYGGGGQGSSYVNFIVNTLKPFIDLHFRTKSDRECTAIGGSDFGALISFYGAMEFQHVFSKALLFSPAFWFAGIPLQNYVLAKGKRNSMKMYFLIGGQEPLYVRDNLINVINGLRSVGFSDSEIALEVPSEGRASISFWQKRFPHAFSWLFPLPSTTSSQVELDNSAVSIGVYPNPATEWMRVRWKGENEWLQVQIVSVRGSVVRDVWAYEEEPILVSDLATGVYFVRVRAMNDPVWHTTSLLKR